MGGHDEREQTLSQLLSEMDGFDPTTGVVVMAATNRPEILDKALLRAGRFDQQIIVDKPDLNARQEILKLHTRHITLADDVDLQVVAQRTPGFVGADLANIANEAAIRAVRENHDAVTMKDFEGAIDRVIAGPEKRRRAQNDLERAAEIARAMVTQPGMSKTLGPLTYGWRETLQFLGVQEHEERNFSEATAQLIDQEVKSLVEEGQQRGRGQKGDQPTKK